MRLRGRRRLLVTGEYAAQRVPELLPGCHRGGGRRRLGLSLGRFGGLRFFFGFGRAFDYGRVGAFDALDRRLLALRGGGAAGVVGFDRFLDVHLVVQAIAGGVVVVGGEFVAADATNLEVGRVERFVGHQGDQRLGPALDARDVLALLVEQEAGDRDRKLDDHASGGRLHRLLFEQSQDRQRQRLNAADAALAETARADLVRILRQRRLEPLARHLQQTETRDAPDLNPRTVGLGRLLEAILDLALVLVVLHVDEVDRHQSAEVADAQLAGDLLGRFEVGVEGRLLDAAALGGARGVDVDRGHRLGVVDDDRAAGGQGDFALEGTLDLGFDLEA